MRGWPRTLTVGARVGCVLFVVPWLGFLVLDRLFPFPEARLVRPAARIVTDHRGEPLRLFLPPDGILRLPVALEQVSPALRRAIVASEDRRLGRHPGVDPWAVLRAAWSNARAGRIVSGASTIPMQIARLVDPRPRTLGAKAIEAFRALQLARRFDADALVELYLGLAPFGGNLEGVGAAAWLHLGVAPGDLSLGGAALLTALPRAPAAYDPARHPEAARRARDRVLEQLVARGAFPDEAVAFARRQPVPTVRQPMPFVAPHFSRWVAERFPGRDRISTTLDAAQQRGVEALVESHVRALRSRGPGNAAAVVLDLETRGVRAMVGSADFFEVGRPGQVNGALAPRSPGSTLKPFLYALAFDRGAIVPDSFLLDVPTDYAGYVPENYDGAHRGRVTAREALVHSLNVPAVRVLADVGLARFHELLLRLGFTTLDRPAMSYGLPLVLGAGEVTLLDLTNAYATLAEGGVHRAVRVEPGPAGPGVRVLSRGAVALVTEVLAAVARPDLPRAWELARDVPAVAWKTGTSYGHRDAWAVGFSRDHAIGVWVGNLDGRSSEGISGADHAAPLLFDLFRLVEAEGARLPESAAPEMHAVTVCAVSHELPGAFCPARVQVPALRGTSRLPTCATHRRAFVDDETGLRLAGACLGTRPHRARIFEVPPAPLAAWWRSAGRGVTPMPALHPECAEAPAGSGPRIVSPEEATPYRVRQAAPAAFQKLRLAAHAGAGTERLYWYQDGRLVGSAPPEGRVFVPLEAGSHRLVVVDDAGRSDAVRYRVEEGS